MDQVASYHSYFLNGIPSRYAFTHRGTTTTPPRNADGTTAGTTHRGSRSRRRQCFGSTSVGAAARVRHGEGAVLQDASSVQRQLRRVSPTREDQLSVLRTPSWRHRAESGSRAGPASGGRSGRGLVCSANYIHRLSRQRDRFEPRCGRPHFAPTRSGVRVCGRNRTEAREREWAEGTVSSLPGTLNVRIKFCHSTGIARSGGGVRASTTSYA